MGIAVGIPLLSCVQAEIYVYEVLRPPSWIFHFRLHVAVPPVLPLEWLSSILGGSRQNFVSISSRSRDMPGGYFTPPISNVHLKNRISNTKVEVVIGLI